MKVTIQHDGAVYQLANEKGELWMGPTLGTWEAPREAGASVPCWMTKWKHAAEAQAALLECDPPDSAPEFVTLRDTTGRASSLGILRDRKYLTVVGVLPHTTDFAPDSVADADRLIAWLEEWKARQL